MHYPRECVKVWNFLWKIIYNCKFPAFAGLIIGGMSNFWPPWCPQKGRKLWFVLNKWQYQIPGEKSLFYAIFQSLEGYFWRNGQFLTPIWLPGCPKKSQKLKFVLNKWLYQISYEKLCFYANLQLLRIIVNPIFN